MMKNALKSIGSFLLTVVTTMVLILAVLGVYGYLNGWKLFNIETGSMSPGLPPGTLVITKPVEPNELKPGDVVTYVFNEQGDVVTHRLVSIDVANDTFVTRGDANNTDDAPENTANIIGKVVARIPKIGPFATFLSNPKNRPYLISLVMILVGASILIDIFKGIHEKKKKEKEEAKLKELEETNPEVENEVQQQDEIKEEIEDSKDNGQTPPEQSDQS